MKFRFQTSTMIIYLYLFMLFLFVPTDSSSIRNNNNRNDMVPFKSSRSASENRVIGKELVSNEPFFGQLRSLANLGNFENVRKDKKKKRPVKKRFSKLKSLKKRQRTRRELQMPRLESIRGEHLTNEEVSQAVNKTEKLQNIKNAIRKADILKALSDYSKKPESKRSKTADPNFKTYKRNDADTVKHATSTRNHNNHHHLSEPLLKMVYPTTPKTDRLSPKYTYRDLITDRERLEQKIKYMKSMLNVNDSVVDDGPRVRRRSDYKIPKMFLTLSAVNGFHGKRKLKCEEDDDPENRVQDVWEKETKDLSRRGSSSNEQRYKVKKWIEFMKNKRSYGKTCPCMALGGEERDVFPLEQTLPKGYLLMEPRDSSEESSETYKDHFYSYRDKPIREGSAKRRLNKNQQDQDSKLKGLTKNGRKNSDLNFTDLELYRSRAKQILRNAEEILDKIKEEEEKRISAPNLLMSRLRELTSAIQGDPRNNENDLIRKLQKNLGWGPLAKSEGGTDGDQFHQNLKSFILDPYEKAKALTDENTRRLTSYILQNLGKIQEPSEEQTQATNNEDEFGQDNMREYFVDMLSKDEKPLPDSLTREGPRMDPKDTVKSYTNQEEPSKQMMDDIIKQQHIKSDEHEMTLHPDGWEETERVGDKATETVRENEEPNLEDKLSIQLNKYDTDRLSESSEKATKRTEEVGKEKAPAEKLFLHSEGTTQGEEGENKGSTSGDMQTEEKVQEEVLEEIMKTINKDMGPMAEVREKLGNLRKDDIKDHNSQTGEELIQRMYNSEDANEQEEVQEVVAPSQKTSGEIPNRDENDVVSSPLLADDYDLLSETENQDTGRTDSLSPEEKNPTGNDPYVKAFNEDPVQIKSNYETVPENQDNVEAEKSDVEPILNLSKDLSNFGSKEAVDLEEQVSEKKPMEGKEVSIDEKQDEEMIEAENSAKEPLESADLVKVNRSSKESSESEQISDTNEGMEETVRDEGTLRMEQSVIDNNTGEKNYERNTNEETLLKTQDPEDVEGEDNQEDKNDTTLRRGLDENLNDYGTEKSDGDEQNQQTIENEDDATLRAENFQTSKEDSGGVIPLKDTLETGIRGEGENYEANLKAEKPTQETEELDKNVDQGIEEELLKETKEPKNSKEIQLTSAANDQDETDLRKTNSQVNSKEDRTTEEANGTPLKAIREEGLEEDSETIRVKSTSQDKDDTQNLRELSDTQIRENEGGEETLKSEAVGEPERNQANEEKGDSIQESNDKLISEESDENLKLGRSNYEDDSTETAAELKEDQENLEEGSILKASDPRENFQTENEGLDNEDTLKTKNPDLETENQNEEASREIHTSRNQENLETDDETALQQANPQVNSEEEQNPRKAVKSTLEGETEGNFEVESSETVKAENPNDGNQNLEEQNANGDRESVKAVFEDEEANEEQETLKAAVEDEEQDEEQKTVKAAVEDEEQDEEQETVKAAMEDEEQEEEQETVKAAMEDEEQEEEQETVKAATEDEEQEEEQETVKAAMEDEEQEEEQETVKAAMEDEEQEEEQETVKAAMEDEQDEEQETVKAAIEDESQDNSEDIEAVRAESSSKNIDERESSENEYDESVKEVLADENQEVLGENEAVKAANAEGNFENDDVLREALENAEIVDGDETVQKKAKSNEDFERDKVMINEEKAALQDELDGRTATQTERHETPLRAALSQENLEKDETLKAENPVDEENEETDSEESLRSAIMERLDNKIQDESSLRAENPVLRMDEDRDPNRSASEESLRESSSSEVDENEDERVKSENFDTHQSGGNSHKHGYESLMEDLLGDYTPEDNDSPLRDATPVQKVDTEENGSRLSNLFQLPEPTTKSLKGSTLKVPKSIGKIMNDLEGQTKDDITSIQNLNPDKIDHIIDKIGEAEQNLLDTQEVDCRKECACAEEMNTRSRNIGRYEIAKDILHWLKDLQLNRVLSDD